jgi:hypothetical protein
MQVFLDVVQWVLANYQAVISALVAVFAALAALFLLIPGEQPEKTLQKIVDFLTKFSKK